MANKVILIGRLGQDPEGGYTDLGKPYANFSLATNERWTDQSGQKQERTEWHRIVLWNRTAEIAMQYLHKGSKVYIEGSLKTRTFTGRDGVEKKVTEVVGNNLEMLDSNGSNGEGNRQPVDRPDPAAKPEPKTAMTADKAAEPPWEKPSPEPKRPSSNDSPFAEDDDMFPDFE